MNQPENQSKKYESLFNDIDQGRIKIPQFQRGFVWDKVQTARLIDSLIKGYPVGTFILWKTRDRLRHYRNLGNIELPEPPSGDAVQYVLDGQQRMTSLYAVRKGIILNRDGEEIHYRDIVIDLSVDPDSDEEVVFADSENVKSPISVHELLSASLSTLVASYSQHVDAISTYQSRLKGYDFSTIVIDDYPIDIACEVFTRINTGGKELTLFEIMVAKTFDVRLGFDLSLKYEGLLETEGDEKDLTSSGFGTIPAVTILQCIAAHLRGEMARKDILRLAKTDVIEAWPIVKNGVFAAVDYLRAHLAVKASRILPYNSLLIPYTWFFIRNNLREPDNRQHQLLRKYFFWASLTNRFTSSVETKMAADLRRMSAILDGSLPSYKGEECHVTVELLMERCFRVGDAFCKAIVCLLSQQTPLSLVNNTPITLDNPNVS